MDFEFAERRLQREQSKIRGRTKPTTSAKAKREAEWRKKQQAEMKRKREEKEAQRQHVSKYYNDCNRALKVKSLAPPGQENLFLRPTSIHGDGDKIALPPSVLERLTNTMMDEGVSSPWTFRVGITKPNYEFPASASLKNMKPKNDDDDDSDDDDDDDDEDTKPRAPYLEELSHKYVSYSHGTVVEFTQEEGHIGLPALIAAKLLKSDDDNIKATRTKDPAAVAAASDDNDDVVMEESNGNNDRTPGHLAYGAFDIPDALLKVEMISLPKARACTLVPSMDAIRSGFFNLKNIKLVLEQSLIRTRATLSLGDTVTTWHRGVEFALTVTSVTPAEFAAVSCINTDMEVEIGPNEEYEAQQQIQEQERQRQEKMMNAETTKTTSTDTGRTLGGKGYTLSESAATTVTESETTTTTTTVELKPEPSVDQKENICTIQIRGDEGTGRRRFDVQESTIEDIFAFARTLTAASKFQLVTRFPRTVISQSNDKIETLFKQGSQEVLMVEKL